MKKSIRVKSILIQMDIEETPIDISILPDNDKIILNKVGVKIELSKNDLVTLVYLIESAKGETGNPFPLSNIILPKDFGDLE